MAHSRSDARLCHHGSCRRHYGPNVGSGVVGRRADCRRQCDCQRIQHSIMSAISHRIEPAERQCSILPDLARHASQNHASTEARMPAVAGAANDRSWGNDDRRSRSNYNWRSRGNDNWRSRGNDNRRGRGNDDRTIRTAPSELVAMKTRPTAALGTGAIDGNE